MKNRLAILTLALMTNIFLGCSDYNNNKTETDELNSQITQLENNVSNLTTEKNNLETELEETKSKLNESSNIQLGVRPYYLINKMADSPLKTELESCKVDYFKKSDFSIGHRGASLMFPEHTKESYMSAIKMGAGIVECDVTFTKDKELVCRHSQCDLHTTTNILATSLANKCSVTPDFTSDKPFENVKCCTSDITLAEFKTLKGKMDAGNKNASTVEEYMDATANFRTDLYSDTGTLMTHKESIELFKEMNVKMTPELKSPSVEMPFDGFSQEDYASKMISEYEEAGVDAKNVFAQSFNYSDILYWVTNHSAFGAQAVYLDGRAYGERPDDVENFADFNANDSTTWGTRTMDKIKADGVNFVAPPMWVLVTLDENNKIVPSLYSKKAKESGLDIITWTLERSGLISTNQGGWYYQSISNAITKEGDAMVLLDVLAQDVGIKGIFSDWPATVTFYANCKGLGL